jgi:putative endonuclease
VVIIQGDRARSSAACLQKLSLQRLRAGRAVRYNSSMSKFFYTSVLVSDNDHNLYIGWTPDLKQRFVLHNQGLVVSTKDRRPLRLVYYESCLSKESAIVREKILKPALVENMLNLELGP